MSSLPKITIVTPSFNQGEFLEETIQSVLNQNYPNLEYMIIDGGSTDKSVEIIKKYQKHITYWCSEPDEGQSEAINKGLKRATGDIIAWLNSDDWYEAGVFQQVASLINPEKKKYVVMGDVLFHFNNGTTKVCSQPEISFYRLLHHGKMNIYHLPECMPCQPGIFWHRRVMDKIGLLNENLHFGMDLDYWLRMLHAGFSFHRCTIADNCNSDEKKKIWAHYPIHADSKSGQGWERFFPEWLLVEAEIKRLLPIHKRLVAIYWWLGKYACLNIQLRQKHAANVCLSARRMPPPKKIKRMFRAFSLAPWRLKNIEALFADPNYKSIKPYK